MKGPAAIAYPSDVAFTPAVKASMEERGSWETRITPDLAEFIGRQASVFLELPAPTVSPTSSIVADRPAF